ncbi:MAG: DNA-directed RNA polymerase subunit alpha [Clostridiales bacterium]|jgi:DNA-directed RNA polymerase subunit alpha|nr:DNA-directed RNA polymerase subunit alpha [Clostridiales bacterium]MDY4654931.1 DNA-directed RNA polymerase subunit alpha [Eubacteriales bacterium]
MMEITKPKITENIITENSEANFVVEPLERGYGTTIGNCLRRILCTDLPGAAIIGIQIEGVKHEFSTVPGVKEDVAEIILNLKDVAIKVHNEENFVPTDVKLVKSTGGVITAADIDLPSDVEVMNPDAFICTLEDGYTFDMTLTVGTGRGYVSGPKNKPVVQKPIGYIPIDSLFSPVLAASYSVEATRVEQSIDYDKLTINVKTNATSTPRKVISLAAKIMNDHLKLFINLVDEMNDVDILVNKDDNEQQKALYMSIEELDLSVRPLNCLKRAGIFTVEDLVKRSEEDMLKVRNLGRKSLDEVIKKLESFGLGLYNKDE